MAARRRRCAMRPLFTVHAGEYLVGSEIEQQKLNG
jgi:hypothetical protein